MLFDPTVTDASFVDGRPPKNLEETIEWARNQLGLDGERAWRIISARTKLGRILFEIEEETDEGPRRLIGKVGRPERVTTLHETLTLLRAAGFAPPSRITVPEPIAFLPERGFILQEKVPGRQSNELILQNPGRGCFAAADCARWLATLHQCGVSAPPFQIDREAATQWTRELSEALADERERLDKIANAIFRELDEPISGTVPSHGDFHPMNIFIAGTQRITGIDIDKFAVREPEADVAWFLMQTAAFGFFKMGNFQVTAPARRSFIQCYEAETGTTIRVNRAALYMAMAFLKNLHFEFVLLKTGRTEYADPWISGAVSAILEGDLYLSENS